MDRMKKILVFVFILVGYSMVQAQSQANSSSADAGVNNTYDPLFNPVAGLEDNISRDFLPVSPTAGSLGVFGQIPVSNYTGVPNINIPVYEIKYKELSVPISLSYHIATVKPELFPGPVGLGWALQAGGVILRVINGYPDHGETPSSGVSSSPASSGEAVSAYLQNESLSSIHNNDPDEFYFNINGEVGKFYAKTDNTFSVQSTHGHSYKIILNKVESKKITFLPLKQLRDDKTLFFPYNNSLEFRNLIIGFTMIDEKGIRYNFGGSDTSIEFSRSGEKGNRNVFVGGSASRVCPMSWFLTSVESPNGYKIEFKYGQQTFISRSYFSDVVSYVTDRTDKEETNEDAKSPNCEKSILTNGCYLKEISFPVGKIVFDNSRADQQLNYFFVDSYLDYDNFKDNYINFLPYTDVGLADTEFIKSPPAENDLCRYKVDAIRIYDRNKEIRKMRLEYFPDPEGEKRLKLKSASMEGPDGVKQTYRFEYNPLSLPPYDFRMTDAYGYYNGVRQFIEVSAADFKEYMESHPGYLNTLKRPSTFHAKAELLNKIIYPGGGYTSFEYEPHVYRRKCRKWPFGTIPHPDGNQTTSGLRIKSIEDHDKNHKLLSKKIYHYVKNYLIGGITSSGVLVYEPRFYEKYDEVYTLVSKKEYYIRKFFRFTTNPFFPLCTTRGNHVTYTEVTVENVNHGYVTYKYKNHDNGYADKELLGFMSSDLYDKATGSKIDVKKQVDGISMELERGQLLSETVYDKNKVRKKEIVYTYNDDPQRFDENVRYTRDVSHSLNLTKAGFYRLCWGVHYTYFPYLKEKTETLYLDKPITKKMSYVYDKEYRLVKEVSTINSDNVKSSQKYVYPHDKIREGVHAQMVKKGMVAYPIAEIREVETKRDSLIRQYATGLSPNPNLILLNKEFWRTESSPLRMQMNYSRYDEVGNPLETVSLSGLRTCYIWSYNRTLPIAKIEGISYDDVKKRLGESFLTSLGQLATPSEAHLQNIRSKLSITMALVTTYTYIPVIGVTSITQPNGLKESYEYDSLGRLLLVRDHNGNIIKRHIYHYAE